MLRLSRADSKPELVPNKKLDDMTVYSPDI